MKKDLDSYVKENKVSDKEYELIMKYCEIRYGKKVTQRKLASDIGIAQSTVARIERCQHSATLSMFTKMLDYLGYHLEIKKD